MYSSVILITHMQIEIDLLKFPNLCSWLMGILNTRGKLNTNVKLTSFLLTRFLVCLEGILQFLYIGRCYNKLSSRILHIVF